MQDNVFVAVVVTVQYRELTDEPARAYYKLSNTRKQIKDYMFHGMYVQLSLTSTFTPTSYLIVLTWFSIWNDVVVIRASVPRMELDSVFEQKNDIAKSVDDQLKEVKYRML